jgi:hypothetical protein
MLPHSFLSFAGACRPFFVTEELRAWPHPKAHSAGFPAVQAVGRTRAVKTSDSSTPGQIMRPVSPLQERGRQRGCSRSFVLASYRRVQLTVQPLIFPSLTSPRSRPAYSPACDSFYDGKENRGSHTGKPYSTLRVSTKRYKKR